MSRSLSPTAKRIIVTGWVLATALFLYGVRDILPPFVLAVAVAYVLNPLAAAIVRLTHCSRTTAVVILYVALVAAIFLFIVLLTPMLIREVRQINIDFAGIGEQLRRLLADYQYIEVMGFSVDLLSLTNNVRGAIESVISFVAARTGRLVVGVLSGLAWLMIILLVSFYMVKDGPAIHETVQRALPVQYQADFARLSGDVNAVLSAYLRGQLALCMVVGLVTWVALALVGVRNALVLAALAGVLEVIPSVGPILSAIPAVAIALFQGSTHLAMANHWFALVVAGLYALIQQAENHFLVPRIVGHSVNLHPVVVIFGALAGASLAGILGVFLAVPTIAVGRVFAAYLYQQITQ